MSDQATPEQLGKWGALLAIKEPEPFERLEELADRWEHAAEVAKDWPAFTAECETLRHCVRDLRAWLTKGTEEVHRLKLLEDRLEETREKLSELLGEAGELFSMVSDAYDQAHTVEEGIRQIQRDLPEEP